ncbi:type II toxin-antitoxin system CcdA family antitoxin [Fluviibacter phosphoraccumulans]|uniref:type II toxin-antitoxin system CcdA family antitoxin n=1 Tax=Fluviibacter phosphoraccumulans TaxID=1751046 RepID=UPI0010B458F6|nr:type II toxin-antitoxin system CcdA family antitoxin [Fluviibacter phosphoraccumulans]BCA65814.1 hypothetical protein SHINM1_014160 [Fluviibacter phosphoraccumulans]
MKKDNDPIDLTPRETRQILDQIENPPQRNDRFSKLTDNYQAHNQDGSDSSVPWSPSDKATQWVKQNREAIESSNTYVDKHVLPFEKVRKF